MASFNTTGLRFFAASVQTAISAFTRVTVSASGYVACAGPTGNADVGVLDLDIGPGEVSAAVRMPTCPGSKKYIADTSITAWGYVYKSFSGYVTSSGSLGSGTGASFTGVTLGLAAAPSGQVVAATALGSVLEVVPLI
jgi:hypothetical protein